MLRIPSHSPTVSDTDAGARSPDPSTEPASSATPAPTAGHLGALRAFGSNSRQAAAGHPDRPQGSSSLSSRFRAALPGMKPAAATREPAALRTPPTVRLDGKTYAIRYSPRSGEAGKSVQLKATLQCGDENIPVRIKVLDRSNEALAYQRMLGENDSMAAYLPISYGAIDATGAPMAFDHTGKIDEPAFLVLRDEVSALESPTSHVVHDKSLHVRDFKLSDKQLRSDAIERRINGFPDKSSAYYATKDAMMNLSRGPFVTHEGGSASKVWQMSHTNSLLGDMLKGVSDKEQLVGELTTLRDAMQASRFAFIDSSLLFIPVADPAGKVSLAIKLIDPTHSFHESAQHPEFTAKKEAAVNSIDWLIGQARKAQAA
ncbi:hypothetical protein [Burkholderia plantarii]|uniref:hypothetical protein n=1 Tax=Burkholderia plantarii TaxID=41899 RepID=UPI0018DD35A7|nr:hypothetical protein [Burkholderia plantarii]MBI0329958.1 hypothetical protein [Burkholderia plantarii]